MLKGKIAVVTGGANGIGKGIALGLAKRGAQVIITDINEEALAGAKKELEEYGLEAGAYVCDVSDENAVNETVVDIMQKFGGIDILVNNAGLWRTGNAPFVESKSEYWKAKINVNILGTMYFTHAVIGHMIDKRYGRIINISSVAAIYGLGDYADYSMTKGAVTAFSKAIAKEVMPFGVTVNIVSPGNILSASYEVSNTRLSYANRSGSTEECANVVCFLASDEASFVSGADYVVDGCLRQTF